MALPQTIWLFLLGALAVRRAAEQPPLPRNLIALDTAEGAALLQGAEARAGYAALDRRFVPQSRPAFCGPATMAILLNALDDETPGGATRLRPFDQRNVFIPEVKLLRPRRRVERAGMPLAVFAGALAAHGVTVETHYASTIGPDGFRSIAAGTLAARDRFMAVNYHRPALGQRGGGHISPLAAYNRAADRFLILDVSQAKYPPVWVETGALHAAMNRPGGGLPSRGFVIARR